MVKTVSLEVYIYMFLAHNGGADEHVIPVLEVIPMPDDSERAFMVMPRMRVCDQTPFFTTVGEFNEFVQQVLEVSNSVLCVLSSVKHPRASYICTRTTSLIG
jgi:hypothetical protein